MGGYAPVWNFSEDDHYVTSEKRDGSSETPSCSCEMCAFSLTVFDVDREAYKRQRR